MAQFGPFTNKQVAEAFSAFDLDGNEFIGASELRQVYTSLGEDVTDEELDEMIKMVDADGDGQISLPEFSKMIFRYAKQALDEDEKDYSSDESEDMEQNDGATDTEATPMRPPAPGDSQKQRPDSAALPGFSNQHGGGGASADSLDERAGAGAQGAAAPAPSKFYKPANPVTVTGNISDDTESDAETKMDDGASSVRTGADKRAELEDLVEKLEIKDTHLDVLSTRFDQYAHGAGELDLHTLCDILQIPQNKLSKRMFQLFDEDGSGTIDKREFFVGVSSFVDASREDRLKCIFDLYDENKDGCVTKDELAKMLKANSFATTDAQVQKRAAAIMRQADSDGDGVITYDEFLAVDERFPNLVFPSGNM